MAFVALSGGQSGILDFSIYDYGYFADTVLIRDGDFFNYVVATYEGNDIIDCSRATTSSLTHGYYLGSGNDRVIGGASNEIVWDGSGDDIIALAAGADTVSASSGNDRLDGGSGIDTLNFTSTTNDGIGNVSNNLVAITCDLALTTAQNFAVFGLDTISSFENIVGGYGSDRFFGNATANHLNGGYGNDYVDGRAGNDTITGFLGSDILIGGQGADVIQLIDYDADAFLLLPARDMVRYTAISESGITAATWDTIINFDPGALAADDRIDLSGIDANPLLAGNQAFTFRGTAAFTAAAGEVRLVVSGADTFVHVDIDTDSAAEMIIKIQGVTGLAKADFIL